MWKFLITLIFALSMVGCRSPEPFAFGVIADIQYADKEDSGARHYRTSADRLAACIDELNRHDLAFTIQLGDIIDGNDTPEQTREDLDKVVQLLDTLTMPTYHVLGNHCLTADRDTLSRQLKLDVFYYDFTVPEAQGWRFIVLDGNDNGYGLIGKGQLAWLGTKLSESRSKHEKVVIFCHFPLLEEAAPSHRLLNPDPVLQRINASGCVVAYFAGHDHAGGYAYQNGIHHVTVRGMVESDEQNAYAIIEVTPERLVEYGFGQEPDRMLEFGGK